MDTNQYQAGPVGTLCDKAVLRAAGVDADAAIRPDGLIVRVPEDPVRVTGQAALELPTADGASAKRYLADEPDGHCGFPEATRTLGRSEGSCGHRMLRGSERLDPFSASSSPMRPEANMRHAAYLG
jgi:hypothetical protein